MTITRKEADLCLWYFKKHVSKDSELIGAFGKGADSSEHDIDIYIPNLFPDGYNAGMRKVKFRDKLRSLLEPKYITDTDWGGFYLKATPFGDVDVFFDTIKFDW